MPIGNYNKANFWLVKIIEETKRIKKMILLGCHYSILDYFEGLCLFGA